MMTAREFVHQLETAIIKVIEGEHDHVPFDSGTLYANVEAGEHSKLTRQYICTTLNRMPEVKAVGKVRMNITRDEGGMTFYKLSINRNPKRKVITNDDVGEIKHKAIKRAVRGFLERPPTVADLEGEQLEGAMIMMRRYNAMFNEFMKEGE